MTNEPTPYDHKHSDLQHIIYGTRQEPVVSIKEIAKIIAERFNIAEMDSLIRHLMEQLNKKEK